MNRPLNFSNWHSRQNVLTEGDRKGKSSRREAGLSPASLFIDVKVTEIILTKNAVDIMYFLVIRKRKVTGRVSRPRLAGGVFPKF
jgi:hypothetical protein